MRFNMSFATVCCLFAVGCASPNSPVGPSPADQGTNASVTSSGLVATAVSGESEFSGPIAAINLALRTISIGAIVVTVPTTAEITRGTASIAFADLILGETVNVHAVVIGNSGTAREVEAAAAPASTTPPSTTPAPTTPTTDADDDDNGAGNDDGPGHDANDDHGGHQGDDSNRGSGHDGAGHDSGDDGGHRGRN